MLHGFDSGLEAKYLSEKAHKDRWAWNFGIQQGRPISVREYRQWKPGVADCRYTDGFVVIVKGTKANAAAIRGECRAFLESRLRLTLNTEKADITHVDDGFVFLATGSFESGYLMDTCPWSPRYPRTKRQPSLADWSRCSPAIMTLRRWT